jgi:hypothetical protein
MLLTFGNIGMQAFFLLKPNYSLRETFCCALLLLTLTVFLKQIECFFHSLERDYFAQS